jgi:hypothetical protein
MDVRELDIDLIDRINPFGEAYAILAKTMSEDSLKQVAAAIPPSAPPDAGRSERTCRARGPVQEGARACAVARPRRMPGKSAWPKAPPPSCASRMRGAMSDPDLDELAAELSDSPSREAKGGRPPREERVIAGLRGNPAFVEKHGRAPQHGEDRDIFERLYAVRLDRLRALQDDDIESGTIYVLRSLSSHPYVAEHRELIHKIGVTGGKVETRIAHAAHDATYLLAEVEIVATYKLAGIHRSKLEGLFHRIFAPAQLDLTLHDRFGHPVRPREWFLVPLPVIDEAVQRILDGTITGVVYEPKTAKLVG